MLMADCRQLRTNTSQDLREAPPPFSSQPLGSMSAKTRGNPSVQLRLTNIPPLLPLVTGSPHYWEEMSGSSAIFLLLAYISALRTLDVNWCGNEGNTIHKQIDTKSLQVYTNISTSLNSMCESNAPHCLHEDNNYPPSLNLIIYYSIWHGKGTMQVLSHF